MAVSKQGKLLGVLGAVLAVAIACGGDDDGKGGGSPTPEPGGATGLAKDAAGKACTADSECGSGARCSTSQKLGTISDLLDLFSLSSELPAPGGYCTRGCNNDEQCGEGGVCFGSLGALLQGECRKSCAANSDCRDGYECAKQAEASTDAGTPTSNLRRLPSQCQGKPTPNVLTGQAGAPCEDLTDGGVSTTCGAGFCANSACTGVCSEDSTCGPGAVCVANGLYGSAGTCQQTCTADTDCKSYTATGNVGCVEYDGRKLCGPKQYPLEPNVVGKACADDDQCGARGQCATTLGANQTPAPEGYCSLLGCRDDVVCGGGACIGTGLATRCYDTCASDSECRTGYSCQERASIGMTTTRVCAPGTGAGAQPDAGSSQQPDAGTPDAG